MHLTHPETGETLSIKDWASKLGVAEITISNRLKKSNCLHYTLTGQKQRILITHPITGETLSIKDWAKRLDCSKSLLWSRRKKGLTVLEILSPNKPRIKTLLEDIETGEKLTIAKAASKVFYDEFSLRQQARKKDIIAGKYRVIRLDAA